MLIFCSLAFTALFFVLAWFNVVLAPRLEDGAAYTQKLKLSGVAPMPLVSVLVPARNEEHQIGRCLGTLLASTYPHFEVIVADDQSTDATLREIEAVRQALKPEAQDVLRVLSLSEPPPSGWTGKARTCHELAKHAKGDILIFCDADVVPSPAAVGSTVGLLMKYRADLVSMLPRQLGGSSVVQALVAVVTQFSILISLPLALVPRLKSPSLATGNGQWMGWRRAAYAMTGGHHAVRASFIEDVELGRLIKKHGMRLVVAFAASDITVRMYESLRGAREGFRKNLFTLLGRSTAGVFLSCSLTLLLLTSPLIAAFTGQTHLALILVLLDCGLLLAQKAAFRTTWAALLRFPIGIGMALVVLCESAFHTRGGRLTWKDRALQLNG